MYKGLLHTHILSVILFLLLYFIKTGLLLASKEEVLTLLKQKTKIAEMIISTLFLLTGFGLLTQIGEIKELLIIKIILVFLSIPIGIIAFKKSNKILAVLMLGLLISAYGLAEMSKKVQKKEVAEFATLAADAPLEASIHGKALYNNYCTVCHGQYGDAGMSGAKNLKISTLTQQEVVAIITNGKGTMPAYAKIMSEKEIACVTEYVISLRK